MNKNITATILIVIGIGIYFTVTRYMIDDAKAVKVINDQYIAALDHADQLIAVRDEITAKYEAISPEDRARLDKMIPSTVDNIRLIIELNNRALQHGFSIQDAKASVPSETAVNGAFPAARTQTAQSTGSLSSGVNLSGPPTAVSQPILDKVLVTFRVTSGYDQFVSFLQDIEADLRIMDITKLTVTVNDTGSYDFEVGIQTYWLRQ